MGALRGRLPRWQGRNDKSAADSTEVAGGSGGGAEAPPGNYALAAKLLLPRAGLTRCVETVEAFAGDRGRQSFEIDLRVPPEAADRCCYVPLLFFDKRPVAPDLEVTDGSGSVIAVPTKSENQVLSELAFHQMAEAKGLDLRGDSHIAALVHDVICGESLLARVSRFLLQQRLPLPDDLSELLRRLENRFVLWVAVDGRPDDERHYAVSRTLGRDRPALLRRHRRVVQIQVETALRVVWVKFSLPKGRPYISLRSLFDQLLLALGAHIVTFYNDSIEAPRFESFHMRATAPVGFTVRQVVADSPTFTAPMLDRGDSGLLSTEAPITVQGNDSALGHIHTSGPRNPPHLAIRIALALRAELIGFWALVVFSTAVLLWLFHRTGVAWVDDREGALEGTTAILLLAPSAASAAALRAEEGGLVRRAMFLTRATLLCSALLSIATALVILFPASLSTRTSLVGDFATAAYFLAALISVSWVLAQRWTWWLYQHLLDTGRANFASIVVLGGATALVAYTRPLPDAAMTVLLVGLGIGFAAIATNRMLNLKGESSSAYSGLASLGALLCFVAAGIFVHYYDNYISASDAAEVLWRAAFGVVVVALVGVCRNGDG